MREIGQEILVQVPGVSVQEVHMTEDPGTFLTRLQGYSPIVILGHSHGAYDAYRLARAVPNLLLVTLDPRSSEGKNDPYFPKPEGSLYWVHVYLKGNNIFLNDWAGDRLYANINLHLGMRHNEVRKMERHVRKYILQALNGMCCSE